MSLKLEIVSEHREIVGEDAVRVFHDEGGTIGRSLTNDWILPDPDRYISGKHATIDCKGGIYYLVDLSTNGVYVNDEREPIGKGNPRRLFNGDRLHFGDFEIAVTIDKGESLVMPLDEDEPPVLSNEIERLVPEESLRSGVQLLDEEALTGDEEFQSVLFGNEEAEEADPEPPVLEDAVRRIPEPKRTEVTAEELFDQFLAGLHIDRSELHPSTDLGEALRNAGEVLREFVAGTRLMLTSRADLKSAFRLDQTSILPRRNNPIKLSHNTDDLIRQLLVGREGEYLGPRDAVREVCQDLLAHQDAFLDAMTAAFVEFAERFDPEELAENYERTLGRKPRIAFLARMKYWDMYRDLYPVLTEKGGGRFPQMFAEEFVRAYERQIVESQRLSRGNAPQPRVKLEPLSEEELLAEIERTGDAAKVAAGSEDEPDAEEELVPADDGPVDQPVDDAVPDPLEDIGDLEDLIDFEDLGESLDSKDENASG